MSLGIYIHWPYCTRICPYCDFNVYRNRDVDVRHWHEALVADLVWWAQKAGPQQLSSIYFGGGTPSLMPPALVANLIDKCIDLWMPASDIEITLEANPTDAEQATFRDFRDAGINRLSLGVQSLRDEALQFLGRSHSAANARDAINLSLEVFDRTSIDLIYARPEQSLAAWKLELSEALASGVSHLSAYQLTIEPDTAFEKAVDRGEWNIPADPVQADYYDMTQKICAEAGLPAYEVSNHAKPGQDSRHNRIYWQYHDYIGIGPGAHGRLGTGQERMATEAVKEPAKYLAIPPEEKFLNISLSAADQSAEFLLMGLRLSEGIDLKRYEAIAEAPLDPDKIGIMASQGLVTQCGSNLSLTPDGRRVLNAVVSELIN